MTVTAPSVERRASEARNQLDEHVREMVAWHFSPETGCPFWLDFRERLDFDPREKVQGFEDLKYFGPFQALPGRVAARRTGSSLGAEGARWRTALRFRDGRHDGRAQISRQHP